MKGKIGFVGQRGIRALTVLMLSMLSLLQCKEKRGWWTTRPIREECFVKLSDSEALTAAAASPASNRAAHRADVITAVAK